MLTKVLAFCAGDIASFSQGVVSPLNVLAKQGRLTLRHKFSRDVTREDLNWCDVAVCCRGSHIAEAEMLAYCQIHGRYTVYVQDDDLLRLPFGIKGNSYFRTQPAKESLRYTMCSCNCLLSYSPIITERYGEMFDKAVTVATSSRILDVIETLKPDASPEKKDDGFVTIGFSGGSTHEDDINRLLRAPCLRVQERYPNARFEFFGAKPAFTKQLKNVKLTDGMPLEQYAAYMLKCHWDIGLAPLYKNDFTVCKCYNKYMEYGASKIAGIYSAVMPFQQIVIDGENGVYAENTEESWYRAMCRLMDDAPLRARIRENAYNQIARDFSKERFVAQFPQKIPELVSWHAEPVAPNATQEPLLVEAEANLKGRAGKAALLLKQNGVRGIPMIMRKAVNQLRRKV